MSWNFTPTSLAKIIKSNSSTFDKDVAQWGLSSILGGSKNWFHLLEKEFSPA